MAPKLLQRALDGPFPDQVARFSTRQADQPFESTTEVRVPGTAIEEGTARMSVDMIAAKAVRVFTTWKQPDLQHQKDN